ncbi:hypothetical protein GCM10020367_64490 [Streptomyces sannanensis]|uniref:Blue (type 1) copper domain-containing protein n=1 Tax=Streptomyces sannanensis TaxID=285536 RepID=A0ABP6S4F0_9ACTN
MRRNGVWLIVAGAAAAVILGIATTLMLAATGAFHGTPRAGLVPPRARCAAPALKGQVVAVTLADMGPGMMGGPDRPDAMRLFVSPGTVATGTVSLRVFNAGVRTHELLVLPLPGGQAVGQRSTGSGGRIDESGSLAESSRSCGAGAGAGITPGATSWTTLPLRPGRYELVCNLPGHYSAGMYAELDVTSR